MAFLLPPALKRSECFLGDASTRMHDGGGKVLATICHTHSLSRDYTLVRVICYSTITHLPLVLLAPTSMQCLATCWRLPPIFPGVWLAGHVY